METANPQNAKIFKAFCDENRLTILALLCTGEKCACRLQEALSIGQSTLSHHMKILCESGVVVARKEGKWTYYAIDKARSNAAAALLQSYTAVQSDARDIGCAL
jgi:ArsR family transcriptional regulator, arsenate/arsenite/antimonite-responsive transcriptional repressor